VVGTAGEGVFDPLRGRCKPRRVVRKQGSWVLMAYCALSSLTGACGGASSHEDSTGGGAGDGTGATGGSSNPLGSGGSGGVPTPPRVGLSLTLRPPEPAEVPNLGSRECYAGISSTFTYALGTPIPGGTIVGCDVDDFMCTGTVVECLVHGDGTFSGSGSGTDANGKKPMSFSFDGRIVDKLNPVSNTGYMTFFSPDTLEMTVLDGYPRCSFGPVTTFKAGAILTDIDCPLIGSADDTTSGCSVKGTIAFEYCETDADTP
jgi:hypothetical protein